MFHLQKNLNGLMHFKLQNFDPITSKKKNYEFHVLETDYSSILYSPISIGILPLKLSCPFSFISPLHHSHQINLLHQSVSLGEGDDDFLVMLDIFEAEFAIFAVF